MVFLIWVGPQLWAGQNRTIKVHFKWKFFHYIGSSSDSTTLMSILNITLNMKNLIGDGVTIVIILVFILKY